MNVPWPMCEVTGCTGVMLTVGSHCLAHSSESEQDAAFREISETGAIDARGMEISGQLLERVLVAVPPGRNGKALFTRARFDGATFIDGAALGGVTFAGGAVFARTRFVGEAVFGGVMFGGGAVFNFAQFDGGAEFIDARFTGGSRFDRATFSSGAFFGGATFAGGSRFDKASFNRQARFDRVRFADLARFDRATFSNDAVFNRTIFSGDADFGGVTFSGSTSFEEATFTGHAVLSRATFVGSVLFGHATFAGDARFGHATFAGDARFSHATFVGNARFSHATFAGNATFSHATFAYAAGFGFVTFSGDARFDDVSFAHGAGFGHAIFARVANFDSAVFRHSAAFGSARFEQARKFGPLLAYRGLVLDSAEFSQPVEIEVSSSGICCRGTRFQGGAQLRLRWARVSLDEADFPAPSILAGVPQLSSSKLATQEEQIVRSWRRLLAGQISEQPQLLSLMRANVAGLGLSNVTVADCRFSGAHNLDKMRLEADVRFSTAPSPWGKLIPGGRQVIAEEYDWRAARPRPWAWRSSFWPAWLGHRPETIDGGQIADLYRALRKGREDAKNEPGAADFYYGEMEMRRHDQASTSPERKILWLYWLISGYGLRALRPLAAVLAIGVIATMALTGWGLAASAPITTPPQQLAGRVSIAPNLTVQVNGTLRGVTARLPSPSQRWTGERTRTALEVTVESFVFRSTDQPLTTAGTWTTIAARIIGPILLALTLLAVRNRVKR
jgi:hypothetical protein